MNKLRFGLVFFAVQALIYETGTAQMVTDDPSTVGKNNLEIIVASVIERSEVTHIYELPLVEFNYGLIESIQLSMEFPFIIDHEIGNEPLRGIGKVNLGTKWRTIEDEKTGIAAGIHPQLLFNIMSSSSEKELTDKGEEFFLPASLQAEFGKSAGVVQIGRLIRSADSGFWFYGLLMEYGLSKRVEIAAEVFGNVPGDFSDNETFLNAGASVMVSKHLRVLLSAGKNIIKSRENDNIFIAYVGAQINL
jgi:hypothetical protein